MAVLSVNKMRSGRAGSVDETDVRRYTELYIVRTDDRNDDVTVVGGHPDIPKLFAIYPFDAAAGVVLISPKQHDDSPFVWEVTVEYSTEFEERNEDPLLRPAEIFWGTAKFTAIAERDIDGNAVTNSAMVYFDPPIEKDDSRPVLTIVRNQAQYSVGLAVEYQDAVNEDPFFGFSPGVVKMESITARTVTENKKRFWEVAYEFHMRREGWTVHVLDQGRQDINGRPLRMVINGVLVREDVESVDPVPLNGAGLSLAEIIFPATVTRADHKFLPFELYKKKPFAPLGLGPTQLYYIPPPLGTLVAQQGYAIPV